MSEPTKISHNSTFTGTLPSEKPCWCGYSSELEPSGCRGSNMIIHEDDKGNRKAVQCSGFAKSVNMAEIIKLIENLDPRYKEVSSYKLRDGQKKLLDTIRTKDGRGAWTSGASGTGKTFLTYVAIIDMLKASKKPNKFIAVKAKDLINAWYFKYSDDIKKYNKSDILLTELDNANVIYIDDLDKLGNPTAKQGSEFSDLFENIAGKKKTLFTTSQKTIVEFCKTISSQKEEFDNFGKMSMVTRLSELCREELVYTQATI